LLLHWWNRNLSPEQKFRLK